MALPKFIVLKSKHNNQYLRYVQENSQVHSFLQFSGQDVASPFTKLEVVPAKEGLVHLKCCYNNRYWVRWSKDHYWLVAAGDEPEEDKSKWFCTLFKPISVDNNPKEFRFLHVQLGHYASPLAISSPFNNCLFAGSGSINKDSLDVCIIMNVESLFTIPKHVGFTIAHDKEKYLRSHKILGNEYLQFDANDLSKPSAWHEVSFANDGNIQIRSNNFSKLWKVSSGSWILVGENDTTDNDLQTLFFPVKVSNDVIALRSLSNNNYCKRFTEEVKINCLRAVDTEITEYSRLQFKELVVSRKISNIKFHIRDARVYDKKLVTIATGVSPNNNKEKTDVEVTLSYEDTKSSSWNSTASTKLGAPISIISPFSFLKNENVFEIKGEFEGPYEWGAIQKSIKTIELDYRVDTLKGQSKMIVKLMATRASADIPFSYTQHDTLINGQEVISNMEDGLYTCTNTFDSKYETVIESI